MSASSDRSSSETFLDYPHTVIDGLYFAAWWDRSVQAYRGRVISARLPGPNTVEWTCQHEHETPFEAHTCAAPERDKRIR